MDELDRAGAKVLAAPIVEPTPLDHLRSRVRRRVYRRRAFVTVVVACVLALPAIALANTDHSGRGSTGVQTTGPQPTLPKATLEIRPVEYDGDTPVEFPANAPECSSTPGASGASGPSGATGAPTDVVILFDRDHQSCYTVGPTVLTGADIDSVSVLYDSTSSQWAVNLEWSNSDFITDVAQPYVNHEVAIVLNGVVQSAPVINPGITGRSVEITGNFSQADALNFAASVLGVAPSAVQVDTDGAPTGGAATSSITTSR